MRISKAVGGPQKHASTPADEEAQQHNGRRRPMWMAAMMLSASVFIILAILAGVAYYVDFPMVCGNGEPLDIPEDELLPLVSLEPHIVAHSSWSLRPQGHVLRLVHPTPYVVLKHTVTRPCSSLSECGPLLRAMQELHWQKFDQPEISYNFLIDSAGNVYEGRGWNGTNPSRGIALRCNIDVALIGNYVQDKVPPEMSRALRWLLDEGVNSGMLAPDYRLLAHNQVKNTISPGRWALQEIADWPHRCLEDCDRGVLCVQPDDSDVSSSL